MKYKKGDEIVVTAGKEKGKHGKIEQIMPRLNKVLIPGINVYKKHVKSRGQNPGGIIDVVRPLPVTNVSLVCPNCSKQTRIGYSLEKDAKVRICRKCGKKL